MVLGAPLTIAEHGVTNFFLPAEHELTESNIRQIALRNGEFVCINEVDERSDEVRAAELAAVQQRLDKIFSLADLSRPAMAGLRAAVMAYRSL